MDAETLRKRIELALLHVHVVEKLQADWTAHKAEMAKSLAELQRVYDGMNAIGDDITTAVKEVRRNYRELSDAVEAIDDDADWWKGAE